jgi:hypothetical protein
MKSMHNRGRPARRWFRAAILIPIVGLSGCFPALPGQNIADEYEDLAGFCGFLQDCGNHGSRDRGSSTAQHGPQRPSSGDGTPPADGGTADPPE